MLASEESLLLDAEPPPPELRRPLLLALVTGLLGACLLLLALLASSPDSMDMSSSPSSSAVYGLVPMKASDRMMGVSRLAELVGQALPPRIRSDLSRPSFDPSMAAAKRRLRDVGRAINFHRPTALETESYRMSQCVGAVYDMATYTGFVGLNIDAMAIPGLCPDKVDDKSCAANAVGVVFNLIWVIANAAQIPVWCLTRNMSADYESHSLSCLVTFSVFFASVFQITSDGLAARSDCTFSPEDDDNGTDSIPGLHAFKARVRRRLRDLKEIARQKPSHQFSAPRNGNTSRLPPSRWMELQDRFLQDIAGLGPDETRAQEKGICGLIIAQTINDFPYTGTDIWATVNACSELNWKTGEDYLAAQEDCGAGAIAILADFVNLVTDIAVIIAACPARRPRKTVCLAISTDITSNLLQLGAWALTVNHSCNENHDEMPDDPDLIDFATAN